jgi:WD40 repeat protein
LIGVSLDGTLRTIVAGNGIVTPMGMAFSPCGELAVSCDDGGMMALVDPAGRASWFFDYLSFAPPESFVAFAPDGTLFTSEASPGFTTLRVAMLRPGGSLVTFASADWPSGLARRSDGTLVVSETSTGQITQFKPDGTRATLARGLEYPQALALAADGTLYAVTGTGGGTPYPGEVPGQGDTIVRITPAGQVSPLAHLSWTSALAIAPSGELFATSSDGVVTISQTGNVTSFLTGLRMPTGLAFDFAGNLYVGDEILNGIVRVGGFPQGTVSGVVVDEAGTPVAGARIQAICEWPTVVGEVQRSSADGRFSFQAAPCSCAVAVTAPGYKETRLENVTVAAGKETTIRVVVKKP